MSSRYPGGGGYGYGGPQYSLEEQLRQLQRENEALRKELSREANLKLITTVVAKDKKSGTIRFFANGAVHDLFVDDDDTFKRIELGSEIGITKDKFEIKDVYERSRALVQGVICNVIEVIEEEPVMRVKIKFDTQERVVSSIVDVKPGDQCLADFTGYVLIQNFGNKDTTHVLGEDMLVTFDDVGGQEDAKRALMEALIEPYEKRAIYERFGMKPSKGVLLWGAPGTGKTMLAKAAAHALAKLHGKSAMHSAFIYVKGPELLNKWVGETESNIRKCFAQGREHHEKHGYPAIIFIDEADALLGRRGSMSPGFDGMDRTIVPQFLSEMDGLRDSGAFVLLATNRPDILDPAVVRDGRIDRKVHVRRPNEQAAADIMRKRLENKPCKGGTASELAQLAAASLYSDKRHLWDVTTEKKDIVPIHLRTLASGAMVAGIAERAAQNAIREAARAVDMSHLEAAIAAVEDEQLRLTHDLNDFMDALDGGILEVKKIKRDAIAALPETTT